MNQEPTPPQPSSAGQSPSSNDGAACGPLTVAAQVQLEALVELKERLSQLHAQLEYTRLMLKLRQRGG